nr:MAG TPA: hypothetical protein [Caudoviricetes sp.]
MSYTKLGNWNDVPEGSSIPSGTTPLSAQTMKHLEDGISNAHTDIAVLGKSLISDTVDIEIGSYTGNGKSGDNYPTAITFKKGKPMFVVILRDGCNESGHGYAYEDRVFAIYGQDQVATVGGASGANSSMVWLVWGKNGGFHCLELYGGGDTHRQMNVLDQKYDYFAIVKRGE